MRVLGVGVERGMLPLLDISLMLLGLMIVVTVARSEVDAASRSVWAGTSIVLLDLDHEDDIFRVYDVDAGSGRRSGAGRDLADTGQLVAEILARQGRVPGGPGGVVVILQGRDLLAAPAWHIDHSAALRDALADYRWHLVWGP